MTPIEFNGVNTELGEPEGWDKEAHGQCISLPTKVYEDGTRESRWELSESEKIKLMAGGVVVVRMLGVSVPIALNVIYR